MRVEWITSNHNALTEGSNPSLTVFLVTGAFSLKSKNRNKNSNADNVDVRPSLREASV